MAIDTIIVERNKKMFDVIIDVFLMFFNIVKIPLFLLFCVFAVIFIVFAFECFILHKKGVKRQKATSYTHIKKRGVFKRLFFDMPVQLSKDFMHADLDRFPYKGIVVFTGRQGNGKSIAMTHFIKKMQDEYSLAKVITNYGYSTENDVLLHWKQLVDYNNGKYGVIVGMDEMQNWLGAFLSRNFPPEMLGVATQNRKNARIICGTSQSFHLLAKTIRSQCTEVRECHTFLGCLTLVRCREPILDSTGEVIKYNNNGFYFFVHNDKLRSMYDTYKVISSLGEQVNNLDKENKERADLRE